MAYCRKSLLESHSMDVIFTSR